MKIIKVFFIVFSICSVLRAQWVLQQIPASDLLDIYFYDSNTGWVTAGLNGLFHTDNGGDTWVKQYGEGFAGRLSGSGGDMLWATGRVDTIIHSSNGGITWSKSVIKSFTDLDTVISITSLYFQNNQTGWAFINGTKNSSPALRLLKTINGGISWIMKNNPLLTSGTAYIQFLDSLTGYITGVDPSNIFKTTDGGETWTSFSIFSYSATFGLQFLTENIGWVSTDGVVITTVLWKTTNGGNNWFYNNGFQLSYPLIFSFQDILNGWIAQLNGLTGTEIWHTSNGGDNWDLQFIYPSSFNPRKIYFTDLLNGWIISWSANGLIFHTTNGGIIPVELTSFTAEIEDNKILLRWETSTETNNNGFEIEKLSEDKIWNKVGYVEGAGTTTIPREYSYTDYNISNGLIKYRLKQTDFDGTSVYSDEVEINNGNLPEFVLEQNYPNPFNSETLIKYYLPQPAEVKLRVFNILGKEAAVFDEGIKEAGTHSIKFNGGEHSSGIYICRVEINNNPIVKTKKMVLLK